MANTVKAKTLKKDLFNRALKKDKGYSVNALAKELFPDLEEKTAYRKLRRYLHNEMIAPEILEKIAAILRISPGYLQGVDMEKKEDLKEDFGSDFDQYFSDNDFDEEGYYFGRYSDYKFMSKQISVDELLIQFLNKDMYTVYSDSCSSYEYRFDFHKLDKLALYELEGMIKDLIERNIQEPNDEGWKSFVNNSIPESMKEDIERAKNDPRKYYLSYLDTFYGSDDEDEEE